MSVFDKDYEEIENNVESAKELQALGRLVIFTMGDRLEQYRKISKLGLLDNEFEIYDFKDETLYRNLMAKYPSKTHIMMGDSISRDIVPAINAGVELVIWYNRFRKEIPAEIPEDVKTKIYVIYKLEDAKINSKRRKFFKRKKTTGNNIFSVLIPVVLYYIHIRSVDSRINRYRNNFLNS